MAQTRVPLICDSPVAGLAFRPLGIRPAVDPLEHAVTRERLFCEALSAAQRRAPQMLVPYWRAWLKTAGEVVLLMERYEYFLHRIPS